jgi:hypothetical protein
VYCDSGKGKVCKKFMLLNFSVITLEGILETAKHISENAAFSEAERLELLRVRSPFSLVRWFISLRVVCSIDLLFLC